MKRHAIELRMPAGPRLTRFLMTTIYRTTNRERVERSRLMYGVDDRGYYLRPLGILNGLFGVVMFFPDEDES